MIEQESDSVVDRLSFDDVVIVKCESEVVLDCGYLIEQDGKDGLG